MTQIAQALRLSPLPILESRMLMQRVTGLSRVQLLTRDTDALTAGQLDHWNTLLDRRMSGEPMAYILGEREFYGRMFAVNSDVLIPRPDTEVLVNVAVDKARALESPAIVDLGTGSGIVAILIARLCPRAQVTAVDVSSVALDVARVNAQRHGVNIRFREGDWYAPLGDERFDLIVSNPPYVVAGDPHLQQNGLPFEPIQALTDGIVGGDGLACIRRLIDGASAHLHTGGWLLMEHGYDQAVEVRRLLAQAGFAEVASWRDSAGIERVSGGRA